MKSPLHRKRDVIRYMGVEAADEEVTHAERLGTHAVMGERYDIWDVHTDKARWWVISPLTNLYSQTDFQSAEMALTYHLGIRQMLMARREPDATTAELARVPISWRRWTQAAQALDEGQEAEDFQAVGMRLRECLVAFVKETWNQEWLSGRETTPKRGDFPGWSEVLAEVLAPGESAARVRSYLKTTARSTWDLVQWLTHATNASRLDAELSLHAVNQVVGACTLALLRFERGDPERCPECASYCLYTDFRGDEPRDWKNVRLCEVCGWEDAPEPVGAMTDSSTAADET